MKELINNPFAKFIFSFCVILLFWFSFYEYIYTFGTTSIYQGEEIGLMQEISILLGTHANFITELFGFNTVLEISQQLVITRIPEFASHGVWLGEACNGLKVMGLFSIFIIVFPGDWKHKTWFIPLGIVVVHFTNAFRISGLTIISAKWPQYLDFNHNVTFQVIVYGVIFMLWYIWVQKFSNLKIKTKNVSQ